LPTISSPTPIRPLAEIAKDIEPHPIAEELGEIRDF
jgi:hypothetical protein